VTNISKSRQASTKPLIPRPPKLWRTF